MTGAQEVHAATNAAQDAIRKTWEDYVRSPGEADARLHGISADLIRGVPLDDVSHWTDGTVDFASPDYHARVRRTAEETAGREPPPPATVRPIGHDGRPLPDDDLRVRAWQADEGRRVEREGVAAHRAGQAADREAYRRGENTDPKWDVVTTIEQDVARLRAQADFAPSVEALLAKTAEAILDGLVEDARLHFKEAVSLIDTDASFPAIRLRSVSDADRISRVSPEARERLRTALRPPVRNTDDPAASFWSGIDLDDAPRSPEERAAAAARAEERAGRDAEGFWSGIDLDEPFGTDFGPEGQGAWLLPAEKDRTSGVLTRWKEDWPLTRERRASEIENTPHEEGRYRQRTLDAEAAALRHSDPPETIDFRAEAAALRADAEKMRAA